MLIRAALDQYTPLSTNTSNRYMHMRKMRASTTSNHPRQVKSSTAITYNRSRSLYQPCRELVHRHATGVLNAWPARARPSSKRKLPLLRRTPLK